LSTDRDAGRTHSRWSVSSLGFAVALLLALGSSVAGRGGSAQAGPPRESVRYDVSVRTQDQTICLGNPARVYVQVKRTQVVDGVNQPVVTVRQGGVITATNHHPDVVRLRRATAPVERGAFWAEFSVEGIAPGTALLTFEAVATGDEHLYRVDINAIQNTFARVTVVQCWEAFTSGLGKIWEDSLVCTLEEPFLLTGTYPGVDKSLPVFFMPTDPTHGWWVQASTLGGTVVRVGSGTYQVAFRQIGSSVVEGNIVMVGTGVDVENPYVFPDEPMGDEIAIKPISDPLKCYYQLP
jgi:hypothetical protein